MQTISMIDLSHTGIVVGNLEAAMAAYSGVFGCDWAQPNDFQAPLQLRDGMVDHRWRSTYTTAGPHHLELIEQISGRFFDEPGPLRSKAHHVGRWVDDLEEEVARLEGLGFEPVMSTCPRVGEYESCVFLSHPCGGLAIELLDRAIKPRLDEWVAGGPPLSDDVDARGAGDVR